MMLASPIKVFVQMEGPSPIARKVNIQISDVVVKLQRQVAQTQEAATLAYHALNGFQSEHVPPLETHTLPIVVINPENDNSPAAKKSRTLNWLFKNAFEEFIFGVNESLIEAHRFVSIRDLTIRSASTPFPTEAEMDRELQGIQHRPLKLPVPVLIDEIEAGLTIKIPFRDEVMSINQVRNCYVHRNGLVTDKDINDETQNSLVLKYVDLITHVEKDGQFTRLTKEMKETRFPTRMVRLEPYKPTSLSFQLGERVVLDADIINGVAWTCLSFAKELLRSLLSFGPPVDKPENLEALMTTFFQFEGKPVQFSPPTSS